MSTNENINALLEPALWQAILDYNQLGVTDFHLSWFEAIDGQDSIQSLLKSERTHQSLLMYLSDYYDLSLPFDYAFLDSDKRFLLMPADIVVDLVNMCGVMLYRHFLSKIIIGADVQRIHQVLGERYVQFALKKSHFLMADIPDFLRPDNISMSKFMETPQFFVEQSGMQFLTAAIGHYAEENIQRLFIKLPYSWLSMFNNNLELSSLGNQQQLCITLLKKILRETSPPCFHLLN